MNLSTPIHPFNAYVPAVVQATFRDTRDEAFEGLHQRTWAVLVGDKPAPEPTDIELVRIELSTLSAKPDARRIELASLQDTELRTLAKGEDSGVAWCIADLIVLAGHDRKNLADLYDVPDPAGILAPFILNIELTLDEIEHAVRKFSNTGDVARLTVVGELLFRWLQPALLGISQEPRPTLQGLLSDDRGMGIVVRALFKKIALWQRLSGTVLYDLQLKMLNGWLDSERHKLSSTMCSASTIKEVLRGAGDLDVYVLAILALCEELNILGPAAVRKAHEAAEASFYKRFRSVLDQPVDDISFTMNYRPFEFKPLLKAMTPVDIDPYKFRLTFDDFASDEFWRLVAPGTRESDRGRAIAFVALSGIVASRRHDSALLAAVRICAALLLGQRATGRQIVSNDIVSQAKNEAGIDLPLL